MKRWAILTAVAVLFATAGLVQAHCGQCEADKTHATESQTTDSQATAATVASTAETMSNADCESCPAEKKAAGDCASCPAKQQAMAASATCTADKKMAEGTACPAEKMAAGDCASCPDKKMAAGDCGACPAGKAMGMPAMTYRVGEQDFAQYGEAATAAKDSGAAVQFVVGENVYEDKLAAMAALAEVTEAKVLALIDAHPQAQEAVAATFASYKVGDKEICCEKMAAMAAEKDGQPVHYIVAGQETACPVTARLLTAQAKLRAAAEAIAMTSDATDAEPAAAMDQATTGS